MWLGTGENCTKGQFCMKTNLHEGTKLHEYNFAPRVNFAHVTIFHEDKKKLKNNITNRIKKDNKKSKTKTKLTDGG